VTNHDLIKRLYEKFYLIRRVEEEIIRVYPTDKVKSPVHLSIGQEAVSVAVCEALKAEDIIFPTYRCHAAYLAKGGNLNEMIAELYGKVTGCGKGKAGSMHLIDPKAGVLGASAVVATSIPQAVGYALAMKMQNKPVVTVCFFGDGATEEGAYHESVNFAVLKQLPILFVCENNEYAIYSHISDRNSNPNLTERAASYGMPARCIKNNDIFEMYSATQEMVTNVRAGKGPAFLEIYTQRWFDHVGPEDDTGLGYRTKESVDKWKEIDQLKVLADALDDVTRRHIQQAMESAIKASFEYAEASKFPNDEELYTHVFA